MFRRGPTGYGARMSSTTSTTIDPQRVIEHAAAHGLGSVRPSLVAIGAVIVVLMVITEWRRAGAASKDQMGLRPPSKCSRGGVVPISPVGSKSTWTAGQQAD